MTAEMELDIAADDKKLMHELFDGLEELVGGAPSRVALTVLILGLATVIAVGVHEGDRSAR